MHLCAIEDFVKTAENGQRLQLPAGTDLFCDNGGFVFLNRSEPLEYSIELTPGENVIPGKNCKIFVEFANSSVPADTYKNIYKIVQL